MKIQNVQKTSPKLHHRKLPWYFEYKFFAFGNNNQANLKITLLVAIDEIILLAAKLLGKTNPS